MGWFGPRGLDSIVFVVMIQDATLSNEDMISMVVATTILLCVFLHGWGNT